jgi:DNA mismatch repair protein MutS2
MDKKSLDILEFPKILDRLAEHTVFSASRTLVRALRPTNDLVLAQDRLARTSEACRLLSEHADISVGGARDVRPQAELAARGGVLTPEELLTIKATLISGRDLFRFFEKISLELPYLIELSMHLAPPEGLIEAISQVLSDKGEVKDSASQNLGAIRRGLKHANERISQVLTRMLNDPSTARMLQEAIITKRSNRYVIPIKAEYKHRMKCVVQDQSSSGVTLFVEPLQVVDLNNDRIAFTAEEKEEVHRILAELSLKIGERVSEIQEIVRTLASLDLSLACAKYAQELNAVEPILVPFPEEKNEIPDPIIKFMKARHPLLDPKTVVPTDILLEKGTHALVITGPNTGGKTISLKTAGLLVAMSHSGLHIPAQSGSQTCVFDDIFADIGDEQSIEQSLSTFSGHVTNIVCILKKAKNNTLVLLDELGAGTDPQEGSALARAILTFLMRRQTPALIATHYPELKAFAHGAEGVLNASVEFDGKSLRPTYRLLIGIPGRSNALAIAKRLGISDEIIQDARGMIDPNNLQADDLINEIHNQLEQARADRTRAEALRKAVETEKEDLQARLDGIEEERMQLLEDARREAGREAEKLYAEIDALRKQTTETQISAQTKKELKKKVDAIKEKIEEPIEKQYLQEIKERRPLRIGDWVFVRRLNTDGIVSAIAEDDIEVQIGKMHVKVGVREIERSKHKGAVKEDLIEIEERIDTGSQIFYPSPGAELHLLGLRAEDALLKLDRYLDSAHAAGLPFVRIVHGKGTGTLRQVVGEALDSTQLVERWEIAMANEGGEGVTIAFLRDN